jgi:hypothetical protein
MYTIFDEEQKDYVKVEEPDHSLTYTYADYMAWKFKGRLELFRGKIFKMAAPNMNLHRYRPISSPMRSRINIQHQRSFHSLNSQ